ncbi:MAG: 50S ribosomal protein L4 [Patescibacteria group bacterium]|jgi:large subunit ribosomal protein L4
MATVKLYNVSGKVIGEQKLSDGLFAVPAKMQVVHQVVVAQQANSRVAIAHTLTKGEVRGGGRKPWKQKGTGRARQGSTRNPQWRGGGVVFGPRSDRNFSLKVNKAMKKTALAMVLSDKVVSDKLIVVDQFMLTASKSKQLREVLQALPCAGQKSLISLGAIDSNVIRASKNLTKVGLCAANSLNIVDLLKYDYFVVDAAGIEQIEKTYGNI